MNKHPLSQLLSYSTNHRKQMLTASTYSVLNKLFDIAPEILIGIAIDIVVSREASFLAKLGIQDMMHQLWVLGAITLLIWVCESLFEYLLLINWRNIAQKLQHELRLAAYKHVQDLDMAYFEDRTTGGLVSILNDDINQLERFLNGGANAMIQVVTTVIAVGAVFFWISPLIAALAFTPIPVIIFGAFYFQRRAEPLYAAVREKVGILGGRLTNNISGIATIKSFTAQARELKQLERESLDYCEVNQRAIALSSAFIPVIRMAILFGFMATLLLGGWMCFEGSLNVGLYGMLVFLTQRLLWPLTTLAETVDLYERAMASTRRIFKLLETPFQIKSGAQHIAKEATRAIEFVDVSFGYDATRPIFEQLSFSIPANQTTAFVGPTGSGKSTIVKLLLRFYDPTAGKITLDSHSLSNFNLDDLRHSIGLVSQDVFLFHGSVRENIAYAKPEASLEEVRAAASVAEADEFISQLPQGYDTIIGERGQKLSGGQRQRISIARALLKNPPIIILDEATSAVDNETEAAIQRSLSKIAVGRTTIVIAHRLSTIVQADQILIPDRGKIVQRGTNQQLLETEGLYKNLWAVQTGAEAGY